MSLVHHPLYYAGPTLSHRAHYKKSCFGVVSGQYRQDLWGVIGAGAVVERDTHYPVLGLQPGDCTDPAARNVGHERLHVELMSIGITQF